MRLVTINQSYLKEYFKDPEMLYKPKRPCALIVKLLYKGHRYDFAVPLRSNISGSAPKDQYFPLPPRSTTEDGNRHGLHYIKMFPVKREWLLLFRTDDFYPALINGVIDKNEKQIVRECQLYLQRYEAGDIPSYATNIDFLIERMGHI